MDFLGEGVCNISAIFFHFMAQFFVDYRCTVQHRSMGKMTNWAALILLLTHWAHGKDFHEAWSLYSFNPMYIGLVAMKHLPFEGTALLAQMSRMELIWPQPLHHMDPPSQDLGRDWGSPETESVIGIMACGLRKEPMPKDFWADARL